ERRLIRAIQASDRLYRTQLEEGGTFKGDASRTDLLRWADSHPVRHLTAPCRELLRINKKSMEDTARESEVLAGWARWSMIALGLAGTAGGLIVGLGLARALSRSVARLEVRV